MVSKSHMEGGGNEPLLEGLRGSPPRLGLLAKIKGFFFIQLWERPEGRWVPEESAGLLSRLTFTWVAGLINFGNHRHLEFNDLWDVACQDEAATVLEKLDAAWDMELKKAKPSLNLAIWRCFGVQFMTAGLWKFAQDCLQFMSPVLLQQIILFLQDPSAPVLRGVYLAFLLLLCNVVQSICVHAYFHIVYRVSFHVRAALISLIYQKALKISGTSRQRTSAGQIVNLQSNDCEKLSSLCIYLHILWSGPFQIFTTLGLLFFVITFWPAMAGLCVMLVLIPFNALMMSWLTRVRKRLLSCSDARVKLVSEVINGMRAIKLYAWEQPFKQRVQTLRDAEMKEIRTSVILGTFQRFMMTANNILVALVSFATYALLGGVLDASTAFPALSLFNILNFPLAVLPRQLNSIVQAGVSVTRLEKFLELPETEDVSAAPGSEVGSISLQDASFTWASSPVEGKEEAEATLTNINLDVRPGELLVVIGEVGAGKSSLLAALMGEIRRVSGTVSMNGRVAYTAQDPWIQNASLRDNVLMGLPLDHARYERVLDVCALRADLQTLPGGDEAEIGEKGINLSGGQKHRVALARAVYCGADVYLLDDPLSAVDTHVGRHLFEECIRGELAGSTRVVVTHQLQYAEAADTIALISKGQVEAVGTFEELKARGVDFSVSKGLEEEEEEEEEKEEEEEVEKEEVEAVVDALLLKAPKVEGAATLTLAAPKAAGEGKEEAKGGAGSSSLVPQEMRAVGKVKGSIYLAYLRSWGPGYYMPLATLAAFLLFQSAKLGNDTWLAVWTEAARGGPVSTTFYLGVYSGTSFVAALLSWARGLILTYGSLTAARNLHNALLDKTLLLPCAFFDTQPTGRLMNRFSRDTEQMDLNLSDTALSFLGCWCQVAFALGIIIYVTPLFAIPLLPILLVYQAVQQYYIATSRELKRLDSVSRSPIFGHFSESVAGLTTIRAFQKQRQFCADNLVKIDRSTRAYFASVAANRWLGMRLEFLGALTVFGTALSCVLTRSPDVGFSGLALTNALTITGFLTWMVRMNAELEIAMNSVERVLEYSVLDTEAPAIVPGNRPPPSWPTRGALDAYGLVVRYRADLDPVLKGMSFSILGGEKVGICGRTGCGKTTLMMTLFRIVEMESGTLLIDGVDVSAIGLFDLRSKLALVPQDPVVFSGSVRDNLNPFGEAASDEELWAALRKSGMGGVVESLPHKLDAAVAEGGGNFSTGQRQLLCMARALLRKSRILVLDEATSNVDSSTDADIQNTIRESFRECTVLTIAHRLHTIIDSDRVMLLDGGHVAEFDTPGALLADDKGRFTGFVNQTLPQQAAALRKVASSQRSLAKTAMP